MVLIATHRITLTFLLDEPVAPVLPSNPLAMYLVEDKPVDLSGLFGE